MSGGHYPPSYHHIQPPPEFISPRHRLPVIPPQGPPSSNIAHAHSSPASWINKHSFSNFRGNTSLYTQPIPKNYSSSARPYFKDESGWSEPVPLTNPLRRVNSNDKSRITYSNDVQQESMDLSSSTHVPSPGITSPKTPTTETTTVPVNGSPITERPEETPSINGSPGKKATPKMPAKKELVSVIAANPLLEKSTQDTTEKTVSTSEAVVNPTHKTNDAAKLKETKNEQSIPVDHVESILETMFHSDTKSSMTASSVIVTTPPVKTDDLRAESVEKILKSPSPVRSDNLENDIEFNSSELILTKNSTTKNKKAIDINETPENVKDSHDKSLDDSSNVDTVSKTAYSKKSDSPKPRKIQKKLMNIEDKRLVDKCDAPAMSKNDKSEEATDISDIKIESSNAENRPKKGPTSDKKSESNKQVPGKSKNAKEEITYVQVETELEKMFAGIEDISMDPVKSTQNDELSKVNAVQSTSNSSLSQSAIPSETPTKPAKKKSSKKWKSTSTKKETKKHSINSKDTSTDSVNIKRVPVIHVEGSKENPINVQIVNSIKLEEDDISDAKTAAKRKGGKCDRANKRLAAGYSVKNYDPESSDESWICIFCKLSAHCPGLAGEPTGELFGPYFLQSGSDSDSKRHSRKTDHLTDPIKKKKSKKQKRSLSTDSDHTTSNSSEHRTIEVWAHENCFIWASGVHLIGSKLIGLDEAVNEALKTICAHCGEQGASIGCRTRHCKSVVHYSCALYTGWNLDSETFIAVCYLHKGSH